MPRRIATLQGGWKIRYFVIPRTSVSYDVVVLFCAICIYRSHTHDVIFSIFQTDEDHGDEPEPAAASGAVKVSTTGVAVLFVGTLMIA